MLHDTLVQYLQSIEAAIRCIRSAHVERYEEEMLGRDRVNLRIRIRFGAGQLLEINEAIVLEKDEIRRLGYRYHLQDAQNRLVFRYDNPPHFSHLASTPHHKHLPDQVVPVKSPSIPQVIEEILALGLGR